MSEYIYARHLVRPDDLFVLKNELHGLTNCGRAVKIKPNDYRARDTHMWGACRTCTSGDTMRWYAQGLVKLVDVPIEMLHKLAIEINESLSNSTVS